MGKHAYSRETVLKKRKFPIANTVLLIICIIVQFAIILFAVSYQPKPQDVINEYKVNVIPLDDGTLDIEYSFVWQALDAGEPLSWITVGMANRDLTIYNELTSYNVKSITWDDTDEEHAILRIDFKDTYIDGDIFEFSFKVNQRSMLCEDSQKYFHEFVPGWFNRVPVEKYSFSWM